MKKLITSIKNNSIRFLTKSMLGFALVFSGFSTVRAQSPYCTPYYAYNYGNCTQYNMSVNGMNFRQGSTILYNRAHNTFGYNGCNAATGEYTLNQGTSGASLFNLKAGATYEFGFTTGNNYACNMFMWLDLNQDNDFSDGGEYLSYASTTKPQCTSSGNVAAGSSNFVYYTVTIPATATPGKTRFRIRSTYYGTGCNPKWNGCDNMGYGECEDFVVTIVANSLDAATTAVSTPLCTPAMTATVTNLGSTDLTSLNIGWSVNGAIQTPNTPGSTLTKQGGSKTITLSPNFSFVDGTNYNVKVWTYGPNGSSDQDISDDTARISFRYVGPAGTPTTTATSRCGLGRGVLKATTPFATDSVVWYNASTGGSIVAKGKNTLSPTLNYGNTNFYAQSFIMSARKTHENNLAGNYTYYTTGQTFQGGYANITPKVDMFMDSLKIRVYYNTPGTTMSIYMRTGSYVGNYATSAYTQIVNNGVSRVYTVSGYYYANIKLPEVFLAAGTTYGFLILTTSSNPVWTFAYASGGHTADNSDMTLFTQHYTYGGSPAQYVSQGYPINLQINYRTATCPSSRVPVTLTVTPTPHSATFSKGTPFTTKVSTTNGTAGSPDVVAKDDQLTYDLTPPKGYTNSNYGTAWTTLTPVVRTKKGTNIPSSSGLWSFTPPSGGNPGKLTVTPTGTTWEDTTITVSMQINDISTYFCDSTITRNIYIAPRPLPDFKFAQPICDGEAVLFSDLSKIASGLLSYKWDFGTGNPADTGTTADIVFKFPTFGTYDVTLTTVSKPYGYSDTKTYQVVVTEIPKIDFKVLNACENVPVQFQNNTTIGAGTVTYDWDFGDPTTTADKSTAKSPTWIYKTPNAYKVRLRASANGCSVELTKNANQFATPTADFSYPGLICDKSEVLFTNKSKIELGNMGYTWNFGDGGVSNFANPVHQFADANSKQVKVKAISEFGCVDSMVRTIKMEEAPRADFTWGPACNLSNTEFTFTGSKPSGQITTFLWNFSGEGTSTVENPSKLFSVVSRKQVTLTLNSNNGCSNEVTKEVNVMLQSKAQFTANDVCEDDDAVFVNKSIVTAGNLIYNWKFGDGKNSAAQSPRHRYDIKGTSTTFNVTLVAIVPGGCSDSITVPVTVNATPVSDFTFKTSGRQVTFTPSVATHTLYQWQFGDGGSSNSVSPKYDYLNFPTGKYIACLSATNAAGCDAQTCKEVFLSGGIKEVSKLSGVKVYPNPNKGNFTVTVEDPKSDISIEVYNLLGEVVKTIETSALKSTYAVDMNVSNGVYLVKVTNGGLTSTQKVTVNK